MQLIINIPTALMKTNDIAKNTPTKTMCLKRNKNAFHLSTAALSTSLQNNQTHPRIQQPQLYPLQQETMPRISRHNPINQMHKEQEPSRFINNIAQKLSNTDCYKNLQSLIDSENQTNKKREFHKYMQTQTNTHTYIYKSGANFQTQPSYQYCRNKQQIFPPNPVKQIYEKELRKSQDGKVNYHFGYLERTGYFYFSIENTLVLYSSKAYENSSDEQEYQPITFENQELGHVLCIKQIIIQDLEVDDIQRHPFGQKNIVLLLWQPWRVNFYAFQPQSLVKYENLYIRMQVSCQCAHLIDYCSKGDVYYLSQNGELGRITLFHRQITLTNFLNWNWNKKFSIRQYFFKFKHNTSRKYQKLATPYTNGVFKKIKQLYLDTKYFWSSKKTKGISLICDKERKILYTLVETSLKNSRDYNRQTNQSHRQIRVYNIGRTFKSSAANVSLDSNLFDRLQAQIYSNPPLLIRQITEEKLYREIGSHFLNNTNLLRFQVFGMYVPSQKIKFVQGETSFSTNLVVILSNSTRLFLFISSDRLILNEMINPPSMDEIVGYLTQTSSRAQGSKTRCSNSDENIVIIGQKQPINFKLLHFLYNKQDRGLALFAVYRKKVIAILFTQSINHTEIGVRQQKFVENEQNILESKCNFNQEQIQVVWTYSLDENMNIFVNQSDFKIFVTPELSSNIYKKKIISHQSHIDASKWQQRGKSGEKPIRRQVLHYPQQYLFINKDKIMGITKLRPVDVLLTYLHKEINSKDHNYISAVMLNENQVRQLFQKMQIELRSIYNRLPAHQIISMLTQIYCDVDATYYCLQFAINRYNKRKVQEKYNKKRQNLSFTTTEQNPYETDSNVMKNNQRYRFTQKLNITNKFKKFRHSDLSSEKFGQTVRMSNSPIKIRSQNSMMKIIQKLLMFIVKNQRVKKNNFRHRQFQVKQNYSNYSSINQNRKGEQTSSKQIIYSIFLYLSRVMCPLWYSPIFNIHFSIFNFIAEITKKIHQIFLKLLHQKVDIGCDNVLDFTALLVQYNLMLGALGNPPNLSYAQGFGIEKVVFQQSIFYSLQKIRDKPNVSKTVNEWRSQFPNYFSLEIFKTIKIQAEISSIGDLNLKKEAVYKNSKSMPHYLLYSYYKDKTLSKKQINELLSNNKSTVEKQRRKLKNLNDLIMTDSLDPYQKVEYAIKEIIKTQRSLEQKQFLILYALQNLNSIRSLSTVELERKQKEVKQIQNTIKIQKLMLKQIQKYETEHEPVNENTKRLINYYLLKPKQLKSLIGQLNNPLITLIFMCTIWDYEVSNANLQSVLRKISYTQKGAPISTTLLRDKISNIFINFPESANRLPLIPFLVVFNQLASKQIQLEDLTIIVERNQADKIKRYFWVPLFFSEWNWSETAILDYYIDQCKKTYSLMRLQPQRRFLYNWISGYALVKFKYQEGRKIFQVSTQIILNLQKNSNLDAKILVNFMKENLGY